MRRGVSAEATAAAIDLGVTACGGGKSDGKGGQGTAEDPASVTGTITYWDTSDAKNEAQHLTDAPSPAATPADAAAERSSWWRDAVIYQVYPRSFADGNGDGMGDLPGITARLPYLKDLGVDAVWLSPFYASPQADAGYDVADYREVDPMFGTLTDADDLVRAAH